MGQWLAIVMFGIFMVLIVVGYPVAFSFALTGAVSWSSVWRPTRSG